MSMPSGRNWSLDLELGPDISRATNFLRSALSAASAKYYTKDMSVAYRAKVTAVLLVALLLNAIIFRVFRRYRPTLTLPLKIILPVAWVLVSYYFVFVRAQLI